MAAWLPVSHTSAWCSLLSSPAGCYSRSAVRCKGRRNARAHDTRTHKHTQFHSDEAISENLKMPQRLTLKADRSISSRLRAGESLAMMEDTKRRSQLPDILKRPLLSRLCGPLCCSVSTVPSLLHSDVSATDKIITVSLWSAAGRASGRERTARAQTRGEREASAPCTSAPPGPCLRDVDGTEKGEALWRVDCR